MLLCGSEYWTLTKRKNVKNWDGSRNAFLRGDERNEDSREELEMTDINKVTRKVRKGMARDFSGEKNA
jgi:hypothetical protein